MPSTPLDGNREFILNPEVKMRYSFDSPDRRIAPIRVRFFVDKSYGAYEYHYRNLYHGGSGKGCRSHLGHSSSMDAGKADFGATHSDGGQCQISTLD
jgi:hypothetical protein